MRLLLAVPTRGTIGAAAWASLNSTLADKIEPLEFAATGVSQGVDEDDVNGIGGGGKVGAVFCGGSESEEEYMQALNAAEQYIAVLAAHGGDGTAANGGGAGASGNEALRISAMKAAMLAKHRKRKCTPRARRSSIAATGKRSGRARSRATIAC